LRLKSVSTKIKNRLKIYVYANVIVALILPLSNIGLKMAQAPHVEIANLN